MTGNENNGKNVLVTGSSAGIGLEIANYLSSLGHRVFQSGRRDTGGLENYFQADLKDFNQIKNLYKHALKYLGKIDVLVNNAGEYMYRPVEKTDHEAVVAMVNLNLVAPYMLSSLVVRGMKESNWGRIINIGSISGSVGEGGASLYSMTKSGLIGLSKSLGLELACDNITVNTINPGWVQTQMFELSCSEGDVDEAECLDVIPQKRFIEPIEIAKMVEYLMSDSAKGITGQAINLCAGLSVGS